VSTVAAITTSNESSASGKARQSPSRKVMLVAPSVAVVSSRAAAMRAGLESMPTTRPFGCTRRATSRAMTPLPHPMSRTRCPGPISRSDRYSARAVTSSSTLARSSNLLTRSCASSGVSLVVSRKRLELPYFGVSSMRESSLPVAHSGPSCCRHRVLTERRRDLPPAVDRPQLDLRACHETEEQDHCRVLVIWGSRKEHAEGVRRPSEGALRN